MKQNLSEQFKIENENLDDDDIESDTIIDDDDDDLPNSYSWNEFSFSRYESKTNRWDTSPTEWDIYLATDFE